LVIQPVASDYTDCGIPALFHTVIEALNNTEQCVQNYSRYLDETEIMWNLHEKLPNDVEGYVVRVFRSVTIFSYITFHR
jgi:hypothetical protein